jgi:small subunit ribosomal protein S9
VDTPTTAPTTSKPQTKKETPPVFLSGKRAYQSTGRRKTSIARVYLTEGSGKIRINERPLEGYFTETKDRNAVLAPLQVCELVGKMDVFVRVAGGGFTGQAGAICQGVARALKVLYTPEDQAPPADGETLVIPPMVKKLRDSGLLTRDSRMKERKKYGLRGARRGVQFSKR